MFPTPLKWSFDAGALVRLIVFVLMSWTSLGQSEVLSKPQAGSPATHLPAVVPALVYVADFDLQAAKIQTDSGRPVALESRGIPEVRPNRRRGGGTKDRDALARELVDGLATSLVESLGKAGVDARRVAPGTGLPKSGWLVRGVFLEVDEGNRLRRAVVGFGSGKTDLQVQATVDRLTNGPPRPYYQLSSQAASGSSPGAVVMLNPVMAAVRFSRAEGELQRNVQETAAQIASSVAEVIQRPAP